MAHNYNNVTKVYKNVIDEVIKNVRESFLNDGVDEQVLQELKQIWESKVSQSRAVEVAEQKASVFPTIQVAQPRVVSTPQVQFNTARQAQPVATTVTPSPLSAPPARQYMTASGQIIPSQYTQILLPSGSSTQHVSQVVMQDVPKVNPPASRPAYHGISVPTIQQTRTQQPLQTLVNQHGTAQQASSRPSVITCIQLDGANDSDSDEDYDDDEDDLTNDFSQDDNDEGEEKAEDDSEPALNSGDDVSSEEESSDLFDTDNVVVCQFDRITRSKNKWKFHLKDGIMNLNGRDYVFQKANGEAEW